MSSREDILKSIKFNKPPLVPLPLKFIATNNKEKLVIKFIEMATSIGASICSVKNIKDVSQILQAAISEGGYIVNTIPSIGTVNNEITSFNNAEFLENIDKAFIYGTVGVAENGAVWVKENSMVNRLLPFICQHLVLVLNVDNIVENMHDAYDNINIDEQGYGVFIAGPSKTADIEQSLVIGAHGARSLEIILLECT